MAEFSAAKIVAGFPTKADGDLPGYKPKPMLFPPGTPKSPYVKDASGMIWQYQPGWMDDMGDVLQPCWEAPDRGRIVVANSPLDLAHYGQQTPQAGEPAQKKRRARKPKQDVAKMPGLNADLNLEQKRDDAQPSAAATSG